MQFVFVFLIDKVIFFNFYFILFFNFTILYWFCHISKWMGEIWMAEICFKKLSWSSVQFSRLVMSNSLWPHGLQHARPLCPSPTPGAYSNSSSLSQWWHPTISASVIPFSSHLQSFPASGSFPMGLFFASGGQSIEVSALTSAILMNIQDWFP